MRNKLLVLLVLIVVSFNLDAQNNKVLLEINDDKIYVDEFLHIYKKNNTNNSAMSYEALREYVNLFINFKLKIYEAKSMGLDTTANFKQELAGYRSQLAQPYLSDPKVEEELLNEAYQRMLTDVSVSHILIKADYTAKPEDTLKALTKINDIYSKLKKGEDFTKLAIANSEDESVKENSGNLGFISVFGTVYEFETEAYNTNVGEFSKAFRTKFGYHILKVNEKRPAKGKYKVAHIMKIIPEGSGSNLSKKAVANLEEVLEKIKAGEDFAKLAEEFSEDRRTATQGGEIGWVSVGGRMIKVFEEAVFNLNKVGDVSPIIKTGYGYHIVKLLEIEKPKTFEEIKNELKSKLSSTARTAKSKDKLIEKLKIDYNVKIYKENLKEVYAIITDSIFYGTWKHEDLTNFSKILITIKDNNCTQADFINYIAKFNRKQPVQALKVFVDNSFNNYVNKMIIAFEETQLEAKYPAYKFLVNEYHDGILLFELTDKTVWSKAINDTIGLKKFYEENKQKYKWDYRYDVNFIKCKNTKIAENVKKQLNKNIPIKVIADKLNKKDTANVIVTYSEIAEKGVKANIDKVIKDYNIPQQADYKFFNINTSTNQLVYVCVKQPELKTLVDAKGIITADYQSKLETQWIEQLHSKYKVTLHEEVLKEITK